MSKTDVDGSLDHLYPLFRDVVEKILALANHEAIDPATGKPKWAGFARFGVFEGYRSVERQQWLYAQGRTRPGNKVTNTPVPSYHGFGLAVDIVWFDVNGHPHWDGVEAIWEEIGHCARANGMVWGGDWDMRDTPHVQPPEAKVATWKPLARKYLHSLGLSTP